MATIQGVYVALFGRPADPTGLAYFNTQTNNGADLTAIGDLASTTEYTTRFKDKTNADVIKSIYQSLFNRDPEAAGLDFFTNALNNGTLTINNIAIAILDGAQGSDKTIVDAKIASADLFTAALDTPQEIAAYSGTTPADSGRTFLADVSTTVKTSTQADAAVKAILDATSTGSTVAVPTNGADVVVPGTVADPNTTSGNDDTITGTAANWDATADTIDGGFGTDTFNGSLAAAADDDLIANGLKSVEKVFLTAAGAATLTVAEAKDTTQIWNKDSAGALTVDGIALGTVVGLKGALTGLSTFEFASTGGTSDSATLSVDTATGAAGVTIAGVETLNITNTGTSVIGTVTAADAKTVNVMGDGKLTAILADGAATTVVNTSTGEVVVDVSGATKLTTYTGGAKVDDVTIDTTGLGANVAIDAGAGNDVLTVEGNGDSDKTVTLTGGAGSDEFEFTTGIVNLDSVAEADFAKSLITITDFNSSEDVIDVRVLGNGFVNAGLTNPEVSNMQDAASLFAAVTAAAAVTGAGAEVYFVYSGDAYIYANNGGAGLDAGDGLVQVTGLTTAFGDLKETFFDAA